LQTIPTNKATQLIKVDKKTIKAIPENSSVNKYLTPSLPQSPLEIKSVLLRSKLSVQFYWPDSLLSYSTYQPRLNTSYVHPMYLTWLLYL